MTEINCPSTCGYLSSARAHPPAIVQRRQERDLRFLLPILADLSEPQYRLLLFFQGITLEHSASALPPLLDSDVAEAASTVAATLETSGKGIIYHHQATSAPAQRLAGAIEEALRRLTAGAGVRQQALERDAAVALRQVARAATEAGRALPGDEAPVYVNLLGRIMTNAESAEPSSGKGTMPGIVIPG